MTQSPIYIKDYINNLKEYFEKETYYYVLTCSNQSNSTIYTMNKDIKHFLSSFLTFKVFLFCLGIPIGVSTSNIKLARELDLPNRLRINDWQVLRDGGKNRSRKYMALPFTTTNLSINGPEQVIARIIRYSLEFKII